MKKLIVTVLAVVAVCASASAQFNLKNLFNSVKQAAAEAAEEVLPDEVKGVLGAFIKEAEVPGTYVYQRPAVEFESENALTDAGGIVAAETVEGKLEPMFAKVGIKPGLFFFCHSTIHWNGKNCFGTFFCNRECTFFIS